MRQDISWSHAVCQVDQLCIEFIEAGTSLVGNSGCTRLSMIKPSEIELYTDSQYVKNGINIWIINWKNNGWKTASKKPVANKELWIELDTIVQFHNVQWFWVKGHSGNHYNEIADQLAVKAMNI